MSNTIYFDMDGTLANLYDVKDWLNKLISEDFSPYEDAEPLLDMQELTRLILNVKKVGYKVGIATWGSKYSSEKFIEKVKQSKEKWINKYLPKVAFDQFVVLDYSCNKASAVKDPFGILFDDEFFVRKTWPGKAYPPQDIFPVLKFLSEESV